MLRRSAGCPTSACVLPWPVWVLAVRAWELVCGCQDRGSGAGWARIATVAAAPWLVSEACRLVAAAPAGLEPPPPGRLVQHLQTHRHVRSSRSRRECLWSGGVVASHFALKT